MAMVCLGLGAGRMGEGRPLESRLLSHKSLCFGNRGEEGNKVGTWAFCQMSSSLTTLPGQANKLDKQ